MVSLAGDSVRRVLRLGRTTDAQGQLLHAVWSAGVTSGSRFPDNQSVAYTPANTSNHLISYVKNGTSNQEVWEDGASKGTNTNSIATFTSQELC
jgi:hypothetical protein